MSGTDSAGRPWAGRSFSANPHGADDGSAPPALVTAIERFRSGASDPSEVVATVLRSRLLVPLVAAAGSTERGEHGHRIDRTQELSIVTVAGPDGRDVLLAFSSVASMRRWDPSARPVPVEGERVALAAVGEGTELVVLDPASPTEFAIRRPALWATARGEPWVPSWRDPAVLAAFESSLAREPDALAVRLEPGDPHARLAAPELLVLLAVREGLDRAALDRLTSVLAQRWRDDAVIAERVDSLHVRLVAA